MNDYYQILEVEPNASQNEIKSQYRFLVQAWHPDKFGSIESKAKAEEKLKQINEAFNVLKDPIKHEQYDRQRQYTQRNYGHQTQNEYERQKYEQEARTRADADRREREQNEAQRREQEARAKSEARRREQEAQARAEAEKRQREQQKVLSSMTPLVKVVGILTILAALFLASSWVFLKFPSPMPTSTATPIQRINTAVASLISPTRTITLITVPILLPTEIADGKVMQMSLVPTSKFIMGSEYGSDNEKPAHTVYLDSYYIDQIEVTNAAYKQCVDIGACQPPKETSSFTRDFYFGNPEFNNYPVIQVDWNMAKTYCEWRGARLPSEAEWEKAATWNQQTQTKNVYSWGNTFDGAKLNFCDKNCIFDWADRKINDGYADTSPVGTYENGRSSYGLYDTSGNVFEWVMDWYDSEYYLYSPTSNPIGPSSGTFRVLRGGSWYDFSSNVTSTSRYYLYGAPNIVRNLIGFRCAQSAP